MSLKPIKLYGVFGPNAFKVIVILEELGLAWENQGVTIADVKKPDYLAVNPNGRLPAIHDPNTDLTLRKPGGLPCGRRDESAPFRTECSILQYGNGTSNTEHVGHAFDHMARTFDSTFYCHLVDNNLILSV
ncbi:hypothetical protein HD806DRAFT_547855 [Xylariaceae sp. AK1471]|nr:hypothetical protein HD806DRAFT_547855 [Xylariaceae sp. AK1471]